MPQANNRFTDDYLDGAVEKMRQCLRDLNTVFDAESARVIRAKCKDGLTNAARIFKEVREEYDDTLAELHKLKEEQEEHRQWERMYRLVQGTIEDVIRGIIDVEELRQIARDYASGDKKLETPA